MERFLGRKRYRRRRRAQPKETGMYCSRCRSHQRQDFQRNGHYPRHLAIGWGPVKIHMPQAKCRCGGYVRLKFGKQACDTVRPRQRFWEDLNWEIQAEYLRRLSYRQIKVDLDQRLESSVGLRTLNQPVLVLGSQAGHFSVLPPGQVPPVVRVNGIWITVMFASGETQTDQAGRQRAVKHAKKVPILTAQGVWPATGQTRLLAWMRAEGEDASSWQTRQAKAVQSLGRYLDETLAFYAVLEQAARRGQQWPARRLRTTSPLERMLRSSWLISGKIDSHG